MIQLQRLQGAFSILKNHAVGGIAATPETAARAADDLARTAVQYGGIQWDGTRYDVGL